MHNCLEIPEVLHLIYEELDTDSSFQLALTCKAFLEPGLDRIWLKLDSLDPLIACLPENLLKSATVDPDGDPYDVYSLSRDLQEEDLSRYFTYYAPRIRRFAFNPEEAASVLSIDALQALQLITDNQPGLLSPNLVWFEWFVPGSSSWLGEMYRQQLSPYMSLFLGHKVTSITVELDDVAKAHIHRTAVRMALKRLGPQLEYLGILGLHLLKYPSSGFPWDQLRELRVIGLVVNDIPRLAALPRLTTLSVYNVEDTEEEGSPVLENLPISNGFPLLESLEGKSDYLIDIDHILRHLSTTNTLKTLIWKQGRPTLIPDLAGFIDIVGRRYVLTSLVRLKVVNMAQPDPEEPMGGFTERIDIAPLFSLKTLEDVVLDLELCLGFTPGVLFDIPRAWPRLQRLLLCPTQALDSTPLINLAHVVKLAHGLPCLQDLGLQFNGTGTGEERWDLKSNTAAPKLHTLRVGRSPIDSSPRVATFLKACFPALQTLEDVYFYGNDEDPGNARRWEAVRKALKCDARSSTR